MADQRKRYFTRAEAEGLIPRLDAIMGRVMEGHAEGLRVRAALQEAQRRVMLSGGTRLDQEFWRSRRIRFARAAAVAQAGVREILKLGGVPKDLELGLVDFLAVLGGSEVHLCWRFGEKRIRFWHGLDEGYAAREPIPDEPDPSGPR